MKNRPTISVITPSYNQGRFIRNTIQSVLEQRGSGWEHIIVDGASTDETVSILESYPHLKWVSEPDQGQADALNKGIRMSEGELIFWINSDDLVAEGAFQAAREFFSENLEAAIVCGNAVTIGADGKEIRRMGPRTQVHQLRHPWNGSTSMHQPGIVFRREVYETAGPFDVSLHYAMDFDFFLRASSNYIFYHRPVDFGLFREYSDSKTGDGAAEAFHEARRCLVRHVKITGDGSPLWAAIRAYFAQGCVWVNDAVVAYERGHLKQARHLLMKGFLRNPSSLILKRHLYFRTRQIIGPAAYERIRHRFTKRSRSIEGSRYGS